jgi:hypothetical protein
VELTSWNADVWKHCSSGPLGAALLGQRRGRYLGVCAVTLALPETLAVGTVSTTEKMVNSLGRTKDECSASAFMWLAAYLGSTVQNGQ